MSKKKKTLNELLEESLIPEDEQPYEIPENWIWLKNDSVMTFVGGGTPSKSNAAYWNGNIPWATVKDVKGRFLSSTLDYITHDGLKNSSANIAYPNELLLITRMSPGKTIITNIETAINQDLKIVRPKLSVLPKYLWVYFENIKNIIEHDSTGTTVKGIQVDKLKEYAFPLPPLDEQKRIINKIEILLAKIDEAQQLIEEAKKTFEFRRAAIIKNLIDSSVSKVPLEKIDYKELKEVYKIFGGGTPSKTKKEYWNGDVNWFSAKDIKAVYLENSMDKITKLGVENSSAKMADKGSIVVVTRSGILQHSLPVAKLLVDATVNQDLKVFSSNNQLLNDFLLWYLQANEKYLLNEYSKSGTTVNSIEFDKFKTLKIPILSDDLLKELLFNIEKAIKKERESYDFLNQEIDLNLLKQSILSKAFKGELGTNDPTDEPAIELLKSILQEKL